MIVSRESNLQEGGQALLGVGDAAFVCRDAWILDWQVQAVNFWMMDNCSVYTVFGLAGTGSQFLDDG